MKPLILFDGDCNLCDASVQFILKRDQGYYDFASLQGILGQQMIEKHRLTMDLDSVVIEQGVPYVKSDAALQITKHLNSAWPLQITKHLNSAWPLLSAFRWLPRSLRDVVYDFIAKHRHEWFGQKQQCLLPDPKTRARFHD